MKSPTRLHYIDNLKGFAILLVVLGHCIQFGVASFDDNYLFRFIYSFHMPLFFMISGFVSYKEYFSLKESIQKRAYQLLLPYMIMGGVKIYIYDLEVKDLFLNVDNFLWFLWTLFFIIMLVLLFEKIAGKNKCHWFYLICFSFVVMGLSKIIDFNGLALKQIGLNMQYFVIGYLCRKYALVDKSERWHLLITLPIFFLLLSVWYRQGLVVFGRELNPYVEMMFKLLVAYLGSYSFFLLFKEFVGNESLLSIFGKSSLGIYALHFFIIDAFVRLLPVPVLFVVVSIISVVIVYIIRRTVYLKPIIGEYIVNRKSNK